MPQFRILPQDDKKYQIDWITILRDIILCIPMKIKAIHKAVGFEDLSLSVTNFQSYTSWISSVEIKDFYQELPI